MSHRLKSLKVISFDVTGTLFVHRYPIAHTYAECAQQSKFPVSLSAEMLKKPFKDAFKQVSIEYPQYGGHHQLSDREWWKQVIKCTLDNCNITAYSKDDFERYFRKIYQFYGSPDAYELLEDSDCLLKWLEESKKYSLGITTNAPYRSIETMLPMTSTDKYFDWFVCSRDVLADKPDQKVFDEVFRQASFWKPGLQRNEILHIGDSWTHDYCGARAAGFQALWIGTLSCRLCSNNLVLSFCCRS